jgi:hypothetical protein
MQHQAITLYVIGIKVEQPIFHFAAGSDVRQAHAEGSFSGLLTTDAKIHLKRGVA